MNQRVYLGSAAALAALPAFAAEAPCHMAVRLPGGSRLGDNAMKLRTVFTVRTVSARAAAPPANVAMRSSMKKTERSPRYD